MLDEVQGLPDSRIQVENLGMSTQISIKARRNCFVLIFLGAWLTGWAFGELFALSSLLALVGAGLGGLFGMTGESGQVIGGASAFAALFLLVWLTFWTFGGYMAGRSFLWQLGGMEIIEVSRNGFKLSRQIFGLGSTKEYQSREVSDLRLTGNSGQRSNSVPGPDALEFDYEFETVGLAAGVSQLEAEQVLEEIIKRYPQYKTAETV